MRVTIEPSSRDSVTIKIEGKIAGAQVPELERAWQVLAPSVGRRKLLVDIRGVTHVDGTGRNLLTVIHGVTNAEFLADTPLTSYFAEQARLGIETNSDSDSILRRQP